MRKGRARITLTTPFGTTHEVLADVPPDLTLTPEDAEALSLSLIKRGIIKIDPHEVARNVENIISTLPEEERRQWLTTLRTLVTISPPQDEPSVNVTLDPYRMITPLPGEAYTPVHVALTPSRIKAIFRSVNVARVQPIVDEVEAHLPTKNIKLPGNVLFRERKGPTIRIDSPFLGKAAEIAAEEGIPTDLFLALITKESAWNPRAVSPKGAIGLGQLLPKTAESLGVNPKDDLSNLRGAAKYLGKMLEQFGSWELALAAYNAGPNAVKKYGGIPPFAETQRYVKAVLDAAQRVPVSIPPGELKHRARLMAEQQANIAPDLEPGQNAAIVRARLVKQGLAPKPAMPGYIPLLDPLDYTEHARRVDDVLSTIPGESPAITALAAEGFRLDFARENFLRTVEPLGTSFLNPQVVLNLLAPTENRIANIALDLLLVGRLAVPVKGAQASIAAARTAGASTMGLIGAGLTGALKAEIRTLGAFDAALAVTQATPSLVLGKGLTKDDLAAGALNMVPLVNIMAPGLGEAFRRNGVEGAIDWDVAPSWLTTWGKSALAHLAPSFERADSLVLLPALGITGVVARRTRVFVQDGDLTVSAKSQHGEAHVDPIGQAVEARPESPVDALGMLVRAFTRGKRESERPPAPPERPPDTPTETPFRPRVETLPKDVDVRRDTPPELLPEGIPPGGSKERTVIVSDKTGTSVPFGYRFLPHPQSEFDLNRSRIDSGEEAVIYTADKSVEGIEDADTAAVITSEPRKFDDGTDGTLFVRYNVKRSGKLESYSVQEVLARPELQERIARARGFASKEDFLASLSERPPEIEVIRPKEGTPPIVGGKRKSAIEENGRFIFVDGYRISGRLEKTGNPVIDGALEIVRRARGDPNALQSSRTLERLRKRVGAPPESASMVLSASEVIVHPDGSITMKFNPSPESTDVDVRDIIEAGVVFDAGTAVLLERSGATTGRVTNLTEEEAIALGDEVATAKSKKRKGKGKGKGKGKEQGKEEGKGKETGKSKGKRAPEEQPKVLKDDEELDELSQDVLPEDASPPDVPPKKPKETAGDEGDDLPEADIARDVIRGLRGIRRIYTTVTEVPRLAWLRATSFMSSIEGRLAETALVRVTQGASRDLSEAIQAYVRATRLLHEQARALVRRALDVHGFMGAVRARIGLAGDTGRATDVVERAAERITGKKQTFREHLDPVKTARIEEQFGSRGGLAGGFLGLFRGGENAVKEFLSAVRRATGLSDDVEVAKIAAEMWETHGDLFATGATRVTNAALKIGEDHVPLHDLALRVLDIMDKDPDIASSLERWLMRVSQIAAERAVFPQGISAAIDAVIGFPAPDLASRAKRYARRIDRERWSPLYQERLSPGGALVSAAFLNGVLTAAKQFGAVWTAIGDMGLAAWLRGIPGALRDWQVFLGRVDSTDPKHVVISQVVREGSGGPGSAATPLVIAADRATRFLNAEAAARQFVDILAALRGRYAGDTPLPAVGRDAQVDRLRSVGFSDEHIKAAIDSKSEVPTLALMFYTSRVTDLGTGTPSPFNRPEFTRNPVYRLVFPFTSFAVRMGQNVYKRIYKNAELRNYMAAKTGGSLEPGVHAKAIAQAVKDRVPFLTDREAVGYIMSLLTGAMLYDHYLVSPLEEAIGAYRESDDDSLERFYTAVADMIRSGYMKPEDIGNTLLSIGHALSQIGAMGISFDLFERQTSPDTGKPRPPWLQEKLSRTPIARLEGTAETLAAFGIAAVKNRGAIGSDEFYLGVAKDLGYISDDPTLVGLSQQEFVDMLASNLDGTEAKKVIMDYLREQTIGPVMSALYSYPIFRWDYLVALHVNTEHHNQLLKETLMRARNLGERPTLSGQTLRAAADGIPALSERWETRKIFVQQMEAALIARYRLHSVQELYEKVIVPEFKKRELAETVLQLTRKPPARGVFGNEQVTFSGQDR